MQPLHDFGSEHKCLDTTNRKVSTTHNPGPARVPTIGGGVPPRRGRLGRRRAAVRARERGVRVPARREAAQRARRGHSRAPRRARGRRVHRRRGRALRARRSRAVCGGRGRALRARLGRAGAAQRDGGRAQTRRRHARGRQDLDRRGRRGGIRHRRTGRRRRRRRGRARHGRCDGDASRSRCGRPAQESAVAKILAPRDDRRRSRREGPQRRPGGRRGGRRGRLRRRGADRRGRRLRREGRAQVGRIAGGGGRWRRQAQWGPRQWGLQAPHRIVHALRPPVPQPRPGTRPGEVIVSKEGLATCPAKEITFLSFSLGGGWRVYISECAV
mmetsp:Transcript_20659/g.82503  ORF Transcript_20659/g.82503 Transcript_20659/m.82503 type:complete len:328 (+) Transcript_20659:133-1116(+)